MIPLSDIFAGLRRPIAMLFDATERIYLPYVAVAIVMAVVVLGLGAGLRQLREGLFAKRVWAHVSTRADVALLFANSLTFSLLQLPWLAMTAGAALWIGLTLHALLGPAPDLGLSPLWVTAIYTLVLFLVWDLSRFWLHRAMHRRPALWAIHQVHHSAEVLTPLTLYRVHPLEAVLYDLRGVIATTAVTGPFLYLFSGRAVELSILGVNALGVVFNALGGNLRHSHVWLSFGPLERWFLSPAQHQVHHARDATLQQTNYGTWLALWDRVGGSWRPAPAQAIDEVGLADANHRFDHVGSMLVRPVFDAVATCVRRRPARAKGPIAVAGVAAIAAFGAGASCRAAHAAPPAGARSGPAGPPAPSAPPSGGADDVDFELDADDDDDAATAPPESGRVTPPAEGDASSPPAAGDDAQPPRADDPQGPGQHQGGVTPGTQRGPRARDRSTSSQTEGPAADEEDDELELDPLTVRGDPNELSRIGGSAHVVDHEDLERKEHDDIHRVLTDVPGVYVREEDGFGLRPNIGMRGAGSDRSAKITLMEDGVLLGPAPYAAPAAYYFPMTTRMTAVEVYKGPSSIRFGPNTIGGAINLQTRAIPSKSDAWADVGVGMRGYGKVHGGWGQSWKRVGVLLEGVRLQSDGFKQLDGGGDTGFGKNELMAKARVHSDPSRRWFHQGEAKVGVSTEQSNETYLGLTDADFQTNALRRYAGSQRDHMKWWRTQAELGYTAALGSVFDVQVRAYRNDMDRTWRKFNRFRGVPIENVFAAPDAGQTAVYYAILAGQEDSLTPEQALLIGANRRTFVSEGLAVTMHARPPVRGKAAAWFGQDIEFGARLHHDQIRRHHTEDGYRMVAGTLVAEGTPTETTARNLGRAVAGAFHVVDAIRLERVTVAPGARVEVIGTDFTDRISNSTSRNFNVVALPGVGLRIEAIPGVEVIGGVHSGFSPVAPGQPREVKPERSVNYEGGLRLGASSRRTRVGVDGIAFFNDYSNMTTQCTISSGCDETNLDRQFNAGDVHVYGVESGTHGRVEGKKRRAWVEGRLTYTYTGSRFLRDFVSTSPLLGTVERGDELPYVPKHLLTALAMVGGKIWGLDLSASFVDEMRDLPGRGAIPTLERIPPHFVLDAGARVTIRKRVTLYLTGHNLTDNRYIVSRRPFGVRPGMPLQIMGGIKIDFL